MKQNQSGKNKTNNLRNIYDVRSEKFIIEKANRLVLNNTSEFIISDIVNFKFDTLYIYPPYYKFSNISKRHNVNIEMIIEERSSLIGEFENLFVFHSSFDTSFRFVFYDLSKAEIVFDLSESHIFSSEDTIILDCKQIYSKCVGKNKHSKYNIPFRIR